MARRMFATILTWVIVIWTLDEIVFQNSLLVIQENSFKNFY